MRRSPMTCCVSIGLAKKFVWVLLLHHTQKAEPTFRPIQYIQNRLETLCLWFQGTFSNTPLPNYLLLLLYTSSYTKFLPTAWTHHTTLPGYHALPRFSPSKPYLKCRLLSKAFPVSPSKPIGALLLYLHYQFTWTLTIQDNSITNHEAQKQANQTELMNGYKNAEWT